MCPRPAVPKNSPLAVYPELPGVTDRESPSLLSLSFQSITNSPICKSSVLMTIQQYGGGWWADPIRSSFIHFLLTSLHPYFITSSEAPPLQTQPRSPQPRGRLFGNCSSGQMACAAPGVTLQPTALFPMFEFGRRNAQPQDGACRCPASFDARFVPSIRPACL